MEYQLKPDHRGIEQNLFTAQDGVATWSRHEQSFFIKKAKRPGDEIDISKLAPEVRKRFTGPGGSREKEWKKVGNGIKVHRGAEARRLRAKYPHRQVRSRWHEKWKDMGEGYDNGLDHAKYPDIAPDSDAKSRWIILGFEDPDICVLNRTVPTPATEDVPMALQMLASLKAKSFTADVSSAFGQSVKGQRRQAGAEPLFATPPTDGLPGEDDDILIEILTEIYGLVSGPPGWRQTLLTAFKGLEFRRHPLAPCVVLMYEVLPPKNTMSLSGLIVIETDDLLGGGIGPKFANALNTLQETFKFGSWHWLQERSRQYGGRTLFQRPDFGFTIDMNR